MKGTLELIENLWLKDTPYLTGDKITIADLLGVCELEQPSKFVVPTTVPAVVYMCIITKIIIPFSHRPRQFVPSIRSPSQNLYLFSCFTF